MRTDAPAVAVVGAGVIGLAVAKQVLDNYPGCHIHVIFDQDMAATVSYGSGGVSVPGAQNACSPTHVRMLP